MSRSRPIALGSWRPGAESPAFAPDAIAKAATRIRLPVHLLLDAEGRPGLGLGGEVGNGGPYQLLGTLPALYPEWLGDRAFLEAHGLRFPYVVGEMAHGIATPEMVAAAAQAGMLGFFGAAGLSLEAVERALAAIEGALAGHDRPWGANLIHMPHDPAQEERLVELYLRRGVRRVSASAYMGLTSAVVRYACSGLRAGPDGRVRRTNHVFAKVSRSEVAGAFLAPAPAEMVSALVARGLLTAEEAAIAARVPVASDLTVEADSGGHTDNRPLAALFPAIASLRDELGQRHGYDQPVRLGAAGGLGTPGAVASAFAMGAAYVLTGSVNQAAVESGLSAEGKRLLAEAGLADVAMAPAGDMFELGAKVQVLKRGTMLASRAGRLYELYAAHDGLESIPEATMAKLEREVFQKPHGEVWDETRRYFASRDPSQLARAERDPKHRMALLFRWYLGQSSRWAIEGDPARKLDYQIWCGPAMGAFNAWASGTFLAELPRRGVVQIGLNLLEGAAVVTRLQQLRSHGLPVPASAFDVRPRPLRP